MAPPSTHDELMAACQHRALVAEMVGNLIRFYQCHHCAARFDHHLVLYVEKPITVSYPEPAK
jgi:hypothetical protein